MSASASFCRVGHPPLGNFGSLPRLKAERQDLVKSQRTEIQQQTRHSVTSSSCAVHITQLAQRADRGKLFVRRRARAVFSRQAEPTKLLSLEALALWARLEKFQRIDSL